MSRHTGTTDTTETVLPTFWWATWWGRLLSRYGLTLASEAETYVQERNEWQRRVSDACGATWHELHGGGAVVYGDLDQCVEQIVRLRERING